MKKKTAIIAISFFSVAVVALSIMAGTYYHRAKVLRRSVDANYRHAFSELVTAVGEMDSALQKSLYATSPTMVSATCTEVFGKAMTAQMSMGVLPFSVTELEETAGFISRVGDYAFALSRAAAGGESYTQEQMDNLKSLSETAAVLADNLRNLETDINAGVISMGEAAAAQHALDGAEGQMLQQVSLGDSMRLIEKEFPEVPSLIYDGPFSEHIESSSPKALEGSGDVSREVARKAAASFSGVGKGRIYELYDVEGNFPCYVFGAKLEDGELSIAVTRQGGKVVGMMSSRLPGDATVSTEEALKKAENFLAARGYDSMQRTYHITQGNILTANFAYKQGEVLCYQDLVKVSVALDNGEVCGFESQGYLMGHYERQIPAAEISLEEAAGSISPQLTVLDSKLALVPSDGKYETLCYEFVCRADNDRKYIVYVNAVSGGQEKILILLEDETGSLTL